MLPARIEQEAGAGLDDRPHLQPRKSAAQPLDPLRPVRGIGRQRIVIDRDRHAPIADLGEQLDGVEQLVMGQAIGVVAEEHAKG